MTRSTPPAPPASNSDPAATGSAQGAPELSPAPGRPARPLLAALAWTFAMVAVLATLDLSLHRFFQMDEYVFVRAAWLVSRGGVPYRDFFEHHTPLFYLLLAPLVGAAPESSTALLWARLGSFVLALGVLALVWAITRRLSSGVEASVAAALLALVPAFDARILEIRPDSLATLLALVALLLLLRPVPSKATAFVAGICLAGALLANQKALYYLWGIGLLGLMEASKRRRRSTSTGLSVFATWLASGFAVPVGLFLAWLTAAGALSSFLRQNVVLALKWQTEGPGFGAGEFLFPALLAAPVWLLAAALGAWRLVAGWSRPNRLAWLYLAFAVPALLSPFLNPIPWPYNLIPWFALLTPLAGVGAGWLLQAVRSRLTASALLALLLALGASSFLGYYQRELDRDNRYQRLVLDRLLAVTAPDDPVFDSNGGYLFRPHAYRYWYHSRAMRELLHDHFAHTMVPSILASGAAVWIRDGRSNQLPAEVLTFLKTHYVRYLGPIYLWGARYRVADSGEHAFRFWAVRDGRYFVRVEGGTTGVELKVGRRSVRPGEELMLSRGGHMLRVTTHGEGMKQLQLLWRPPRGGEWAPFEGPVLPYYPYFF